MPPSLPIFWAAYATDIGAPSSGISGRCPANKPGRAADGFGMLAPMNYEDRPDLVAPEQVVSKDLLAKLRGLDPRFASRLIATACDSSSARISDPAWSAIAETVEDDTAPSQGAPPEARALEEDSMSCGYRFGILALDGATVAARSATELRERADAMYLYDLVIAEGQADVQGAIAAVLARHHLTEQYALEEAAAWAWYFGLGLAVVEADRIDLEPLKGDP